MECLITPGLRSHMTWRIWKIGSSLAFFSSSLLQTYPNTLFSPSFSDAHHNIAASLFKSQSRPKDMWTVVLSCHRTWEMLGLQWQGMESFSRKTFLSLTNWCVSEWAIAPFTYFLSQSAKLTVLPKVNHHVDDQTGTQWNNIPRAGSLFCTCY